MQKKKILYVVTLSEIGGAQKYVMDLAKNLREKYDIMVVAGGKINSPVFKKLTEEKIKYYPLKHLKRQLNPISDILSIFELRKLIKLFKPDIIHLNSSKASVIGSLAVNGIPRIKVIYTAHGFVFNESLNFFKKIFYKFVEKFFAIYKNKIITVSEFDKQSGIKNKIAPAEKFITINNGIDIHNLKFLSKEEARQKLNLPQTNIVIGTIANYYPVKALHRIIEVAKIITKKFNETKFILIGDGLEKEKLQKQIRKENLTNNFLLGPIENASCCLKAFDIFILPSKKEGFPYVILEAMLAEIPIVATNVGGISEMIDDNKNGFLVQSNTDKKLEQETIEQLARKIIYYLKNREIAKIFANEAYKKANKNFTLKRMIEKTEKVYND
ncbi:MAG: glycosyltransferase family 4 protein [Patescibacteria group bacterium]|nr:glycosyltransferase family 4 protein [Patescibacteria group bacterium]